MFSLYHRTRRFFPILRKNMLIAFKGIPDTIISFFPYLFAALATIVTVIAFYAFIVFSTITLVNWFNVSYERAALFSLLIFTVLLLFLSKIYKVVIKSIDEYRSIYKKGDK